ncbi:MAG: S24/S26 family peptidase [Clostridia bacterium]|nr:S24/S26 family peptidase [Clostridia bacterium]
MKLQSIEQALAEQNAAYIQTVGVSMEPMLHERESTVVLERPHGRLARGDVALFRRGDGQLVLHRVIRVRPRDYLIRGDSCLGHEVVPDGMVIGVMKGYYEHADSPFISRDAPQYRRYVRTVALRHVIRRIGRLLALPYRGVRKLIRCFR